jgi:hypothetical protein
MRELVAVLVVGVLVLVHQVDPVLPDGPTELALRVAILRGRPDPLPGAGG